MRPSVSSHSARQSGCAADPWRPCGQVRAEARHCEVEYRQVHRVQHAGQGDRDEADPFATPCPACDNRAAHAMEPRVARSASPDVNSAAPSRMTSFMRKPPIGFVGASTPGVVTRNESVTTNMPAAARLAYPEILGNHGRTAMRSAAVTSNTPSRSDVPRSPKIGYNHDMSGLFCTSG